MLLLSREDIKKVFTMRDAIEADKEAFRLVVEGKCDSPLRTNIQAPKYDGCFLFMPAYVEEMDTAAVKIVNIFPHNIDQGKPSSPAQVLLIDGKTGIVTAVLDGTYVTQIRTGAASGAAFDVLAKKDCRIGALIGTGVVASFSRTFGSPASRSCGPTLPFSPATVDTMLRFMGYFPIISSSGFKKSLRQES